MTGSRPPAAEDADRRTALSLVPVSRETEERLAAYVDLLRRWQRIKNLVGPSTLDRVWTRHVADSAQLVGLAPDARRWVDLGSGAGFPGLVVAVLLVGRAGARVDLIESNARKCAFLREAVRVTGAPAHVHPGRIEAVLPCVPQPVEIVTSRALAPLPNLLALSKPLLDDGATGLFLTGDGPFADHAVAGYRLASVPSVTHAPGRIVSVRRA